MSGDTVTKSELIARLAARHPQLLYVDSEIAVKTILSEMIARLVLDQRIEIRGFGSFHLHHRPARTARNPRSGKRVKVLAKLVPHFRPGKDLRQRVDMQRRLELERIIGNWGRRAERCTPSQ